MPTSAGVGHEVDPHRVEHRRRVQGIEAVRQGIRRPVQEPGEEGGVSAAAGGGRGRVPGPHLPPQEDGEHQVDTATDHHGSQAATRRRGVLLEGGRIRIGGGRQGEWLPTLRTGADRWWSRRHPLHPATRPDRPDRPGSRNIGRAERAGVRMSDHSPTITSIDLPPGEAHKTPMGHVTGPATPGPSTPHQSPVSAPRSKCRWARPAAAAPEPVDRRRNARTPARTGPPELPGRQRSTTPRRNGEVGLAPWRRSADPPHRPCYAPAHRSAAGPDPGPRSW